MIVLLVTRQHSEGQVLVTGQFYLAGGHRLFRGGVEKQQKDCVQLDLIDQIQKGIKLVIEGQSLEWRLREKGGLVRLPGKKRLGVQQNAFVLADPLLSQ